MQKEKQTRLGDELNIRPGRPHSPLVSPPVLLSFLYPLMSAVAC